MSRYTDCLLFVLRWEGGYVNDPADPGGATNKGITQAVYDDWRTAHHQERQSVQLITSAEVGAIYEANYWNACRCGDLPAPVDLVVFDSAVNCGVGRASRWLQHALGVAEDGVIGPKTVACARESAPAELAKAVAALRAAHYQTVAQENPKEARFLGGWNNRLESLKGVAHVA